MLILPLHQPLDRTTFPWATAILLLINIGVFLLFQSGDGRAQMAAHTYYVESGLVDIEAPLYRRHLSERPTSQRSTQPAAEFRAQFDRGFRQRLNQGELFESEHEFRTWRSLDERYRSLRNKVFSERYALQDGQARPTTLLSSQFLHGDLGHLFGNMLFLVALGLLVEGPLGPALFVLLYLTGGAAAGAGWLWAHTDGGSLVGASGAIAALMGAFCVLWGRRKVRFFYWFFVVFDYVRAPALFLLPVWLGWELLQMMAAEGSPVAYEAHASGIVAGAALALAIRRLGWQRDAAFADAASTPAHSGHLLEQARALLGQLKLHEAESLLSRLELEQPGRFDVALLRLRCARYAADAEQLQARLRALIERDAPDLPGLREQARAIGELHSKGGAIAARALLIAQGLADSGDAQAAVKLALDIPVADLAADMLAAAWFRLALCLHEQGQDALAGQVLGELRQALPQSPQAGKAAFLLGEWKL